MPKFCKTVQVFDKDDHGSGLSMGYTTRLYQDALEMCGRTLFGAPSLILPFVIILTIAGIYFMHGAFASIINYIPKINNTLDFLGVLFAFLAFFLPLLAVFYYTLFTPSETPIIFDRKNQKVYWVSFVGVTDRHIGSIP